MLTNSTFFLARFPCVYIDVWICRRVRPSDYAWQ